MNETVMMGLVAGAGGLIAGAGVMAYVAGEFIRNLKAQHDEAVQFKVKEIHMWHHKWERVNNKLAIIRDATKEMKVSVRNKKSGSFSKHVCVYNRLMGILSENGYDF